MNVNLGSSLDRFVSELVRSGLYQSQSEVLREGLRLLKEREDFKEVRLAELRKQIALGIRQADRGEFRDGPRAFAKIRRKSLRRRRAKR
jgi:antitoxin ParD1/3/4